MYWILNNLVRDALIYDLEILNAIPPKNPQDEFFGMDYCEGWHDHKGMGISVICAYDCLMETYRVFCEDNWHGLLPLLNERAVLVGFNNINFDNKVLRANNIPVDDEKCFDILREIWKADGLGPEYETHSHNGYSLDDCARANFGFRKSGNGALTPIHWQEKKIGSVIDYCLRDVFLTKRLYDKITNLGKIKHPKNPNGPLLYVRKPSDIFLVAGA